TFNELLVTEPGRACFGQALEFPEQAFVHGLEIKTGLSLHPLAEFTRHALQEFRRSINRHEMETDVGPAPAHASKIERLLVGHHMMSIEHVNGLAVLRNFHAFSVGQENLSQL